MNFYFTYASSSMFPFQYGCTKVVANTKHNAIEVFNKKHPLYHGAINCSFIYDEQEFEKASNQLYKEYCLKSFSKVHETLYQYQITQDEEITLRSLLKHGWDAIARDSIGRLFAYNSWNTTYDCTEPTIILFEKRIKVYRDSNSLDFVGNDKGLFSIHDILENSEVIDDVQTK